MITKIIIMAVIAQKEKLVSQYISLILKGVLFESIGK